MSVQKLRQYLVKNWQTVAGYGGAYVAVAAALYWRLGSLVGGYAPAEASTYQSSQSFSHILHNPLNAPFLLIVKTFSYVTHDSYIATRLVATLFGLFVLVIFTKLLSRWYDTHTAVIATLLFGLSAWFLHVSRLGTPDVLQFGVFALAGAGYWLKRTNHWLAVVACFLLVAGLIYVPGMIWFIILGIVWQWKTVDAAFKKHLMSVSLGALLLCGAIAPLGWAIAKNHALIKPLLALPTHWPAVMTMVKNLLEVPFHLFIHNSANPVMWLGTAPILSVFSLTMFVLGGYMYLRHVRLARTPIFISIIILTAALMAIGGSVTFSIIIPFIYLVVAAGVSYLLNMWFKVFPRNPLARSVGWGLFALVVSLACAYQLTHYFVGWPHASSTRDSYTLQKP